jgi:hypothetical protein
VPQSVRATKAADPTSRLGFDSRNCTRVMAMEYAVQRLEIGDVVLIDLPGLEEEVEATVVRAINRTERTVRVLLRVEGRRDFIREWPIGEMITVVRGP